MTYGRWNWKGVAQVGIAAGLAQVVAGVAIYLGGVYFFSWSILVSALVLLVCMVLGIKWYSASIMGGHISARQTLVLRIVISISTGLIYAVYNLVSISFFYPHFLDDLVRFRAIDTQQLIRHAPYFPVADIERSALEYERVFGLHRDYVR